jgi:hypothetical protein
LVGKKKLELYSLATHISVPSGRVGESCNKQVKGTNKWRVLVAKLEEKMCYSDRMGGCELESC